MPRQFHFAGKIDENTPVLGSTHGHVQKVIEAGFEEQFRLQKVKEASRNYQQAGPLPDAKALLETMKAVSVANVAITGGAARQLRVLAHGGLDRLLSESVIPKVYQAGVAKGFAEAMVDKMATLGTGIKATVSDGLLIMRTGTDPGPAPTYQRRVGDKDVSR